MNQPPFDRKDLSVPPLDGPEFIQLLHDQRNEMYPQPPAFYEALIEGRLSREVLALWVKNQYYYWGYGLTFSTGAIVCKTNEPALRRLMIRKSVRVEGKNVVNDLNPEWVETLLRGAVAAIRRRARNRPRRGDFLPPVHPLLLRRLDALPAGPLVGMELAGRHRQLLRRRPPRQGLHAAGPRCAQACTTTFPATTCSSSRSSSKTLRSRSPGRRRRSRSGLARPSGNSPRQGRSAIDWTSSTSCCCPCITSR